MSTIPLRASRSAGVTLIRTLIEIASDQKQDKLFQGMSESAWKTLKEIKFFPVSSSNPCTFANSTVISTPKNHRLCFSVLKTLPTDILEILGKSKRGNGSKSKGYMEKYDNERVQDLVMEEYEETLKQLFKKLGVNTDLDVEVLLGHIIKSGELTEAWVKRYNELTPNKRLLADFQKRASGMYEERVAKTRRSYLNKKAKPSIDLQSVATDIMKKNRFVKMWNDYKSVTYDNEDDDEDEDDWKCGQSKSDTGDTGFDIENIKSESELNDVRFSVLKAQHELGKVILALRSNNPNRAVEIEKRLHDKLSGLNAVWIRRNKGGVDCAKRASSTFYTFDFKGKWTDK